MGLDMYLNKFIKIDGLEAKDYGRASELVASKYVKLLNREGVTYLEAAKPVDQIEYIDFEEAGFGPGSNALNVSQTFYQGDKRFPVLGVEMGYWRKANAIHRWFVNNVQGGVDDCNCYFVQKSDLTRLRIATYKAIDAFNRGDFATCAKVLPAQDGFFFGSQEYGDWYREDLLTTLEIIDDTLLSVDWANDVLIYRSSW